MVFFHWLKKTFFRWNALVLNIERVEWRTFMCKNIDYNTVVGEQPYKSIDMVGSDSGLGVCS